VNRAPARLYDDDDMPEEITEEWTVKRRIIDREALAAHPTRRMPKIDDELLAMARGEVDPAQDMLDAASVSASADDDDPWGGLIPVFDVTLASVPRLVMTHTQLVALPIDHRAGFLLSHIDGIRTVEELVDICHLSAEDAMQVVDALLALGAIDIE
jgi:hypothetical protein